VFGEPRIAPLRHLHGNLHILALSNGPTLAFKDMAMQLLGHLFEYELNRRGERLNILGATSGDTGSAAEYAMRGKKGVQVFMTSPYGRMSKFQQAQMFSLQDKNIFNLSIRGVFDDCQDIVKAVSHDLAFKKKYNIGTVNSINWARLLAQVVYYFAAYFQATSSQQQRVSFAVPSGNFGNVCAGHVARMMGLPISQLVVATNENDVLNEFFLTGHYKVRDSAHTFETSSPSMDISKASNFERFIFDLLDRDAGKTQDLFDRQLNTNGFFTLAQEKEFASVKNIFGFVSGKSSHADRLRTIREVYQQHAQIIDPHTADGLKVAQEFLVKDEPMVVLETALPVKFSDTIQEAIDCQPDLPEKFKDLDAMALRYEIMPPDVEQVKSFIAQHC
jgi:threonine synthase